MDFLTQGWVIMIFFVMPKNLEAELSHENDIFNGENYANIYGLPTKFYTGTIALDLSDMSYYMDN